MSDLRAVLPIEEVCRLLGGLSRRMVYRLIAAGQLAEPRHMGRRSFWTEENVKACQDARQGLHARSGKSA